MVTEAQKTAKIKYEMTAKGKESTIRYRQKYKQRIRDAWIKLKSHPCSDCLRTYEFYVMDFDHVPERGEKKYSLGQLGRGYDPTSKVVQEELAKCDLVCANCHRVRTYNRREQRQELQ